MTTEKLRFLADESCDFAVTRALRMAGYDVLAVAEYINLAKCELAAGRSAYRHEPLLHLAK